MRRILLTTIVLLATAMYAKAGQTLVPVADGVELGLTASSAQNAQFTTLSFGTGCTLKLTGDAAGGLFELKPAIVATNGVLTVDATELANCTGIRWLNHLTTDAGVTVKGLDYVLFGPPVAGSAATTCSTGTTPNNSYIKANFSFVDGSGGAVDSPSGIVLTNMVAVALLPTCPYSVAAGAWIWPSGVDWPASHVGTFELTDYNYGVVVTGSLNAAEIKVGAGCELSCRLCAFLSDAASPGIAKWGGSAGRWRRNVILDGGTVQFVANQNFTLSGSLTGAGDVNLTGNSTTTVSGEFSVEGTVSIGASSSLSVGGAAYAKSIVGVSTNKPLVVSSSLTAGTVSGALRLSAEPGASVVISNLAAGASVCIPDGVDVTVLSTSGAVPGLILANDNGTGVWRIGGPADGAAAKLRLVGGDPDPALVLNGRIDLADVPPGLASVTIGADAVVAGSLPDSCHVHSLGGQAAISSSGSWQRKLWLWCDASVEGSIVPVSELSAAAAATAGSDVRVWQWHDR